jgi:hypothetical protein
MDTERLHQILKQEGIKIRIFSGPQSEMVADRWARLIAGQLVNSGFGNIVDALAILATTEDVGVDDHSLESDLPDVVDVE